MTNWYDDQKELLEYAEYLNSICEFSDASEAIYFFEKPWKWNEEYKIYKDQRKITNHSANCYCMKCDEVKK